MPTSTTRKRPADRQAKRPKGVTSAADWKSKSGGKGVDLELPSGNVAKVKPIQITKLVEMDVFPDSLEQIIASKTTTADGREAVAAKKPDAEEAKAALANPKDLAKLMTSVDRITAMAVLEPKVLLAIENVAEEGEPDKWEDIPDDERDEDALYTDEVDLEDKMFIFQFCVGGTSDLDRFRAEFGASLGAMGDGQSLPG